MIIPICDAFVLCGRGGYPVYSRRGACAHLLHLKLKVGGVIFHM